VGAVARSQGDTGGNITFLTEFGILIHGVCSLRTGMKVRNEVSFSVKEVGSAGGLVRGGRRRFGCCVGRLMKKRKRNLQQIAIKNKEKEESGRRRGREPKNKAWTKKPTPKVTGRGKFWGTGSGSRKARAHFARRKNAGGFGGRE